MTDSLDKTLDTRFAKIRWQQDLARRGQERKEGVSPDLAEALRKEIRMALDADGKPFDLNVARRVYDLAIAARDMCVAATDTVKEAVAQIEDTNGPMETLQDPDTPESAVQASETFGAKIVRELLALVPSLRPSQPSQDPRELVHAIAEARSRGMSDVAEELEVKLFGRALTGPRPVDPAMAMNLGSYWHGYSDGKHTVPPDSDVPEYKAGYLRGTEARFLGEDEVVFSQQVRDHGGRAFELRTQPRVGDLNVYLCGCGRPIRQFEKEAMDCPHRPSELVTIGYESEVGSIARSVLTVDARRAYLDPRVVDPPLCETCKADPDPRGTSTCAACREIWRKNREAAQAIGAAP